MNPPKGGPACQYAKEDTAAVGWVVAKGLFGNGGPS